VIFGEMLSREPEGKLRWPGMDDDQEVILAKEPQTSWCQRFMAGFYRILPIRGQL